MKKIVRIVLAILMVMCLALGIAACKSDCEKGNHATYIKSEDDATCTSAKVEHWACQNCDWTEDRTVGQPFGHDYTNVNWTPSETDASKHERGCTRCDYVDIASHTTGAATCPDCGKDLGGSVEPCTHPNKTHTDDIATCTTAKVEHWTCPDCDWTEDKTIGEPLGHDYTGVKWTVTDTGSQHQRTCTVAGCGHVEYGDHTPIKVDGYSATCKTEGKGDGLKCSVCEYLISEGDTIPAIPHNYEGQVWKTASGKHYQECAYGCGARNEHNAQMGTYQKVGDNHVSSCAAQGCTIKSEHPADFGDWTITETSHYKQCTHTGCTFKTEVGDHDQDAIENKNTTQHTVACSACGKTYPDANHVWGEFTETKAPTCTVEGIKTRTCECGAIDTDTIDTIDHTESYENTETHRIVTCSVCGTELDRIEHVFEWYDGDRQEHYKKCETCDYILESTRAGHNYTTNPEEFVCSVCGRVPEDVIVSVYYNGTYTSKDTLADAIAFVTDNTAATIYLGQDLQGAGIVIPENRNITLRMLGNTYTVTSPVSDTTQGIVLSKGSTVRILNGTITTAENSGVTTLVANYANLTLTNSTLDGTKLDAVSDGHNYTLRSYFGTTSMTSSKIFAATATEYALEVLYGTADEYMDGVSVTVGASSVINGYVRYGSQVENTDWSKVVLRLRSTPNYLIHFSCDVDCDTVNIKKVNTSTGEEAQLAHRKDQDWTHDETKVTHYHLCTRCGAHTDEASCELTTVTVAGTPATCTKSGLTDGAKCSECGTILVARTTINALGHNYVENDDSVTIIKDATCTEDGSKTVQCSRCAVTETRTIDALGHDEYKTSEDLATCTTAKVEHWACHRCSWTENRTIGTALGHNLSVGSTTAATCTTAQINHMVCSRCDYTEDQTVGAALGHDWAAAWTAVDALQHAHLCQRAGCDATDGAEAHTYTSNHCGTCGKDVAQSEIIDLMADLSEKGNDGDWLVSESSKFVLTGIYDGQSEYKDNYKLVDDEGELIVICYKLDVSDLVVGDKITVTGKIKKYKTTIEFDQGCTYEVVKRGESEISVSYNKEQVEVSTIADKAERNTEITFTVTAKDGYKIDSITLNGQTLTPQDGEYKFTVGVENVIEITSSSANALPKHNASGSEGTVTITNTEELNIGSATTSYTGDNGSSSETKYYLGLGFDWNKVIRNNNGFQMNAKSTGTGAGGYLKITAPANITNLKITITSEKNYGRMTVNGITASGPDITLGDNIKEITISSTDSITISSIEITYSTATACTTNQDPAYHEAASESCTDDGHKEYWQCKDCEKYFVKNEAGKYVETTLADITIKAHHTLTKVNRQEATCTEAGHVEHWICSVEGCGAKFTDENGTTPIDDVTISATGHDYKYTSNNDGTHTGICQNNNSHVDANVNCTSATWKHDADNHWKVCDVCNVKFGEVGHSGETACGCGALKLTYKVYNELYHNQNEKTELTLAAGDLTVAMPIYAAVDDTITVTATSTKYDVMYVANGTADFTKSSGTFSGAVTEGGIIEIYVKLLSSAKYVGATVNGEKKAGDVDVTATVGGDELENNAALAEGNVISIAVMYAPDDYVITVTVTQGSSVINQEITLGDYDEDAMAATGTYTCAAKGDVTITVTARAKYMVTIPNDIDNVTFVVKKVVDGTNDIELEDGAIVLAGDKLSIDAVAAANCRIVEGTFIYDGVNDDGIVTGDVSMLAEAEKKMTVKVDPVDDATITVTVGDKTITATNATVSEDIYITADTVITITVTVNTGVNKEVDTINVNNADTNTNKEVQLNNGAYTYTISKDANAGTVFTVSATLKDKPAEPQLVYTLTTSTSGSNSSYTGNCDVKVGDITWNVEGNSQMNPWRFGGKSLTKADRNLTSRTAMSDNIRKIVVNFGTNTATVNSVTFKVYDSDPKGGGTVIYEESLTYKASSSVTIEKPDNADWRGCYYQVTFNVTAGSSNQYVTINTIQFYA